MLSLLKHVPSSLVGVNHSSTTHADSGDVFVKINQVLFKSANLFQEPK